MQNDMRDRLVEIIGDKPFTTEYERYNSFEWAEHFADHLIANGVIVPQWISVDDRLPKADGTRVIVTNGDCYWEDFLGVNNIWVNRHKSSLKQHKQPVTHWQPLPEPPKAEQKLKELSENG